MAGPEQEAEWKADFERIGETAIRDDLSLRSGIEVGINSEPKRQFAFRWLRDKERERERREQSIFRHVRWTFWAAVAAVLIGLVGVIVTIFSGH